MSTEKKHDKLEDILGMSPADMNFVDYQAAASKTAIYKEKDRILYPALGLANEAGEVLGKIKKVLRDSDGEFSEEQRLAIADECGDVLWYISALCRDIEVDMQTVAIRNLTKLFDRKERDVLKGSGDNR